ncbi:hypothetical protein WUBG_03486 [Wuchereria bancrofti]|uniref:Uncharacterized protein n=1 Tax=Wuchereria bancrofti TaxID=6293 RepID=J9F7W8_WUCBA|nr:hypothetical protein WUBG_03486 [Wuchereria bancrofti]
MSVFVNCSIVGDLHSARIIKENFLSTTVIKAYFSASDTFDWSTKDRMVSQHINLNIDGPGHSISCDEINVKIKQSFSTLNNLENDIDEAARFLQTSFSNRLSISSPLEYSKVDDNFSFKGYILEKDAYNDHLFPKQNVKGITRGKILGCQLKAHIAYGKNITEMSQHLRDVRDAFNNESLLREYEISDGRDSDERCFDRQSSFYATAEQRMNKALQYNSLSNDMYKPSQYPLKERNCDPVDLRILTISKINSLHDDNDTDDAMNEIQNAKSEVTSKQSVIHQANNSNMKLINEPPSAQSAFNDASQSDKVDSSPMYSSQELLKREHYANNTVKALRQFYTDSMLYFVELHYVVSERLKIYGKWKIKKKNKIGMLTTETKIYQFSSRYNKNLIDYHLHETARIQLLNLDLQKHLTLLRGKKKDVNFENFRKGSEKVLLFTKDFEKNNLANELEKWELKLKTRSRGFKINGERAMNIDNTRSSLSSPLRVFRNIRKMKVQKPTNYNKNLEQLREELKWKRKEADFMKKTFDQRVMRNVQRYENSLRAQIDAHVRYITETEKDIAQLNKLENGNDGNSERSNVMPTSSYERYPFLSSMNISAQSTFLDGGFLEADRNETSFSADIHSINKSCNFESNSKKRNIDSIQFSKPLSEEESGTASASGKYKNFGSPRKTHDACHFVELFSSSTLTPSGRLTEQSQKINDIEKNCSASNETQLSIDKKSAYVPKVSKDSTDFIIHSPESTHSSELVYGETANFKQDTSKEALLISVAHRSDINDIKLEQQKQSIVKPNDTDDENKTTDGCNLLCNSLDEQFFTPIASDIETDNEEKNGTDEMEKDRITSQESLSSFHTTSSSLTPIIRVSGKTALTQSSRPRKFKLTVSPLSSPGSAASTKYAASMPREDAARSTTNSPHTSKASSSRCISPLSASLLESLLEDSLTTMLTLEHSQASESETFVHHGERNKNTNLIASADNSSQSDRSYDLNKIPVPEDLIPGLDLSGVNSAEAEAISEKNDFPSKLDEHPYGNKEFNVSIEIRNDQVIKSSEPVPSSQFRYYIIIL